VAGWQRRPPICISAGAAVENPSGELWDSDVPLAVRVYYEDTDSAAWCITPITSSSWSVPHRMLRDQGFEQPELLRDHSVIFVVRAVQIEYLRPAMFNDLLM